VAARKSSGPAEKTGGKKVLKKETTEQFREVGFNEGKKESARRASVEWISKKKRETSGGRKRKQASATKAYRNPTVRKEPPSCIKEEAKQRKVENAR